MHVYRVRTPNPLRSRSQGFRDGRHGGPDPAARGTAREGRLHCAHDREPADVQRDVPKGDRKTRHVSNSGRRGPRCNSSQSRPEGHSDSDGHQTHTQKPWDVQEARMLSYVRRKPFSGAG